jgi:SLOG cluster3 family
MRSVFLSASIPLPDRDARYWQTADVIAIRDSIRALVSVVVPTGQIIFGGHPAITPLIRLLVREMRIDVRQHVILYLSRLFEQRFPPEVAEFEDVRLVDAVAGDEAASLKEMRRTMIGSHEFDAGIFLGGMEGVEREYEMFRVLHPDKPALPIASTGAAARLLFDEYSPDKVELLSDLRYLSLFRRLLNFRPT